MSRQIPGIKLALLFLCLGSLMLTGCESLHHNLRQKDDDPAVEKASAEKDESDDGKILDVKDDGKTKKPFFKSSRLPGGLSSESREIEADMGIGR